jgi:CrcB protein
MSRIDRRELAAIFLGGALGALARVALVETSLPSAPDHWPWPTFIANIAGAFLLGYFSTRLQDRLPLSAYRRPLLGTGFCGALTTFSTLQIEILRMYDAGIYELLALYVAITIVAGYTATHLATALVRRVSSLA